MALGRTLALIAALGCGEAAAADYTVRIDGSAGTAFAGTCLVMRDKTSSSHAVSGAVPVTVQLSGDLISCAIQKKAEGGSLHVVISKSGGGIVADTSDALPFGVLIAAGR